MTWLQIGRVGVDTDQMQVESASWGSDLQLSFLLTADTRSALVAAREQLVGLRPENNPDELVIPVVAYPDDGITGFWTVTDVSCDMGSDPWGNLAAPATVTLQRISSSSAPLVESRTLFTQRTPGGPAATHWIGLPASAWRPGGGDFPSGAALANGFVSYGLAVDDYYRDACVLSVDGMTVVGRQIVQTGTVELSNGLIRVAPSPGPDPGTDPGACLAVQLLSDGVWGPQHVWRAVFDGSPGLLKWYWAKLSAVEVLRNAPECVSVRMFWSAFDLSPIDGQYGFASFVMDVTLRRGARYVEVRVRTNYSDTQKLGIRHVAGSVNTGTSFSSGYGLTATAVDTAGLNWNTFAGQPVTLDTATGSMYLATAGDTDLACGLSIGFASDTANLAHYMSAGSETVRVVGA
jgi:hypothetical protein